MTGAATIPPTPHSIHDTAPDLKLTNYTVAVSIKAYLRALKEFSVIGK